MTKTRVQSPHVHRFVRNLYFSGQVISRRYYIFYKQKSWMQTSLGAFLTLAMWFSLLFHVLLPLLSLRTDDFCTNKISVWRADFIHSIGTEECNIISAAWNKKTSQNVHLIQTKTLSKNSFFKGFFFFFFIEIIGFNRNSQ